MGRDESQSCGWARHHEVALLGMLAIIISGMAFSIFWNRLFYDSTNWYTPGDLWSTFRAAQYVSWGGESQIYNNPAAFQTFPGIAFILAPLAKLASIFHLSSGFPTSLPQPTAWWILGPVELALGASLLFPLDTLARKLDVPLLRRVVLLTLESALIWPSVVLWGHPEDALSLTLALYGLMATANGTWRRVGIYFGLAIAIQPLVVLLVPIVAAIVPMKRWPLPSFIMIAPAAFLLLPPLLQEWGPTTRILLRQPNFTAVNHPTPWASVAPVLNPAHVQIFPMLKHLKLADGHHRAVEVLMTSNTLPVVAAGPGRILAVLIALLIGAFVKVRRPSWPQVIWLATLALSLRCVFEPVMVPYYLLPGLALALVVASLNPARSFALAAIAAAACTWLSYLHVGPWVYYLAMTVPLAVTLITSWPRSPAVTPSSMERPATALTLS